MNWLDIVLIVVFLYALVGGSKKGLVKQLIDFIGFFVAIYLAGLFSGQVSLWLKAIFKPGIQSIDFLSRNIDIVEIVINLLAFMLLFYLLVLFFKWLSKALNTASKLPLVGLANTVGGGFIGAIKGLLIVLVIIVVLSLIPASFWRESLHTSLVVGMLYAYLPVLLGGVEKLLLNIRP